MKTGISGHSSDIFTARASARNAETAAQAALDARALDLPPKGRSTLADLYDPLTMPAPLVKRTRNWIAQSSVATARPLRERPRTRRNLFSLYEQLTAPSSTRTAIPKPTRSKTPMLPIVEKQPRSP